MASEGRYDVVFGAKTQEFARGAKDVTQQLNFVGGVASNLFLRFAAPLLGMGMIKSLVRGSMEWGEQLQNLSKRTGLSIERLQEWEFAAKTTGTTLDAFVMALQNITRAQDAALHGNAEAIGSFKGLGMSLAQLASSTPEEVIMRVAEAYKAAGGGAQAMADVIKIGGRGIGDLLTAFAEGLSVIQARAHEAGAVVDTEIVQRLAQANQRLEEIELRVRAKTAPAKLWLLKIAEFLTLGPREIAASWGVSREEGLKRISDIETQFMRDYGLGPFAVQAARTNAPTGAMALPLLPREATNLFNVLPQVQAAEATGDMKTAVELLKRIDANTNRTADGMDSLQ